MSNPYKRILKRNERRNLFQKYLTPTYFEVQRSTRVGSRCISSTGTVVLFLTVNDVAAFDLEGNIPV